MWRSPLSVEVPSDGRGCPTRRQLQLCMCNLSRCGKIAVHSGHTRARQAELLVQSHRNGLHVLESVAPSGRRVILEGVGNGEVSLPEPTTHTSQNTEEQSPSSNAASCRDGLAILFILQMWATLEVHRRKIFWGLYFNLKALTLSKEFPAR